MMHFCMFLLCLTGFAALAFATERQQEGLLRRVLPQKAARSLRIAGWLVLAIALLVAIQGWGWGFGLVCYSGYTSFAAGLVYLALIIGVRRRA